MPSNQSEGKRSIISCKKFDPSKVTITELDTENERSASQSIAYVHYQYKPNTRSENLIFQTGDIKLTDYGIPDIGDYAKEDKERQYVKVPIDLSQPACVELQSMLEKLDDYVRSKQNDIFGKSAKLYKYVPLVREATKLEGIELEEKKNAYFKKTGKQYVEKSHPAYCKVKFDVDYNTKQLETAVYDSTSENEPPKEIDVTTITELTHHVRWQSKIKMIVMVNKFWAQKTSQKKGEPREFGLGLKCLVLHVKERAQSSAGSVKDQVRSGQIDFVEESDDDDEEEVEESTQPQKVVQRTVANDDDDDDEDDDDDVVVTQPVQQSNNEDEDEDDSDDSPPPPPSKTTKAPPKTAPKVAPKKVATK